MWIFVDVNFMLTWLESLTSSRFPSIGFCYQKTCDNKWWFSVLILFCFQTASNFVTVLFFLPTSHLLLLFSTKSQRAKNVTQLFLFISISTIWNNRFSDFSCSLFSYYGKKCAFFGNTDLIFLGIVVVTQIEPEMTIW